MRTDPSMLRIAFTAAFLAVSSAAAQAPAAPAAPAPPAPPAAPAPPTPPRMVEGDKVWLGKDRTVAKGVVIDGDIAHVGGDLRVEGEVRGDVGVIGGDLELASGAVIGGDVGVAGGDVTLREGSLIRGEVAVKGGEIRNNGGRVLGEMHAEDGEAVVAPVARAERRAEARRDESWFAPIGRALAGIFSTLGVALVLAGAGAALVFYGLPYLRTVSDTARVSTLRAGGVGLAATFLIIPAYLVLLVLLAVSIIGIPLLIVAVPLYPLAVVLAIGFGLIAAAHAIGERTIEQRNGSDIRYHNAYAYVFAGIAILLAPVMAAHLVGMTGFLGFVSVLLGVAAGVAIWAAATIGLGAVILSRAGTRRLFAERFDATPYDPDPLFDHEPTSLEHHV